MRAFQLAISVAALNGATACNDVATPRSVVANIVTKKEIAVEDTVGDTGPIRLTYICGTTFRVRNFGTDTATVTWDVKKTDEHGTLLLRGRGSSVHSDTTFTTQHTGIVRLYRNGTLLQSKGKVSQACVAKPRLTVIIERGVTESHALRDADYRVGATVNYNFQAKPGFENVLVTLDGTYVPAIGELTMGTDHVLIASADSVVKLVGQEQQLSTAIRNVVTGPDPVAAYRTLITQLGAIADRTDLSDMLQRAAYVAYDPIADSAALRHADELLANHVFTLNLSTAPSKLTVANLQITHPTRLAKPKRSRGAPPVVITAPRKSLDVARTVAPDSLEPTTYLYVNGIFTSPEKCAQTLFRLRVLLRQIPRLKNPSFALAQFYNRSMWHQIETPEQRRASCIASLETRMPFLGSRSWGPYLEKCYGEHSTVMPTDNDITEAITQYVRLQLKLQPNTPDAEILADTLQQLRSRGRHVIMIPHSQGNLMVEQAVNVLRSIYRYDETHDSIGLAVVPLAAPTSNGWEFPAIRIKPITVLGDIVPDIGLSNWPRMTIPKSTAATNEVTNLLARAPGNPVVTAYAALLRIANGVTLHDVDETYLQGTVGLAVRDSAASSYREVAAGELNFVLTADQLPMGEGRNLPLYGKIFNQQDLGKHNTIPLSARDIAWRSTDPSIVTVSPQGQVTAVAVGSAAIWGRTWADSAAVQFTILPVPDKLNGTYQGYWETLDYSVPYIKDATTMTLHASGTTVTGTVSWSSEGKTYISPILSGTLDPTGTIAHITLQPPDPEAVAKGKRCNGSPDTETSNGNANQGAGGVDCYQVISVHLSGTQLYGTSYAVGPIWNRIWTLERTIVTP